MLNVGFHAVEAVSATVERTDVSTWIEITATDHAGRRDRLALFLEPVLAERAEALVDAINAAAAPPPVLTIPLTPLSMGARFEMPDFEPVGAAAGRAVDRLGAELETGIAEVIDGVVARLGATLSPVVDHIAVAAKRGDRLAIAEVTR